MTRTEDLMAQITGHDRASMLARASLESAAAKFDRRLPSALLVEVLGDAPVSAYKAADISRAVQDATGKIGRVLRPNSSDTTARLASDRSRALLVPDGQAGATFRFTFGQAGGGLFRDDADTATTAERAALELVTLLPSTTDDTAALDGLLSQRIGVRSAIDEVADVARSTPEGMRFELVSGQAERERSVLTQVQAERLHIDLSERNRETRAVRMIGVLDGMRTQRRIFYLNRPSGGEIWGAIEPHQLPVVRSLLSQRVVVELEESRTVAASGRRSRATYRLLSVEPAPDLFS